MLFTKLFIYSWFLFHKKRNIIHSNVNNVGISELEMIKELSFINKNKTDGKDYRIQPEEDNEKILQKIKQNLHKYNQLRLLENPNISIITKMTIVDTLEKDSISGYNIEKGGFWRDWE